MAYSDYGGRAYRDGLHVADRSDYTITGPEGGFGTPGQYPGFGLMAMGRTSQEIQAHLAADYPVGHAVLGDGPVFVALYKQLTASVYRGVGLVESLSGRGRNETERRTVTVDDHRIEAVFTREDNFYAYARLEQPDGVVWAGWSGYGVGAGLEDADYSTEARDARLREFWPDAIK